MATSFLLVCQRVGEVATPKICLNGQLWGLKTSKLELTPNLHPHPQIVAHNFAYCCWQLATMADCAGWLWQCWDARTLNFRRMSGRSVSTMTGWLSTATRHRRSGIWLVVKTAGSATVRSTVPLTVKV